MSRTRIAVLGAGAWGTALALSAARAGHDVRIWGRDPDLVADIKAGRNRRYLPGIDLAPALFASTDLDTVVDGTACLLAVVPAQSLRSMAEQLAGKLPARVPVVVCAKGIERATGALLSAIVRETLPDNPPASLSGPSFASDVARGLPTAVTVAAEDEVQAARLAALLSGPQLRCYSSSDLVGVELGGALKNVLALAAGAAIGAGLGASAQAAIVTRGFVELRRLAGAFGARPETLMGLSGRGDLVLTCGSAQSRNFSYGMALGRGDDLAGLPLAEGVATAGIASRLAREKSVETPIVDAVKAIIERRLTIGEAVEALLSRPLRAED